MKGKKIGYWVTTGLLAVALLGSSFGKFTQAKQIVENTTRLGLPPSLLYLLGFWYTSAAIAILVPGFTRVKEWAYAGVIFAWTGAIYVHFAAGDPVGKSVPLFVLTAVTIASYLLRPDDRKLIPAKSES